MNEDTKAEDTMDTDASARSVHLSGFQTIPGLSPGKSRDIA